MIGVVVLGTIAWSLVGPDGDRRSDRVGNRKHNQISAPVTQPTMKITFPSDPVERHPVSGSPAPKESTSHHPTAQPDDDSGKKLLRASSGRPFAPDSAWNTKIPPNPKLASNSSAAAAHLASGVHANLYEFGSPVYYVGEDASREDVGCTEDWGPCRLQDVPIPTNATTSSGSDGSMIVVDAEKNKVYDFWQLNQDGGGWSTSWGTKNPLYGKSNEHGGAVGAGYSGLAGLVRTFEIAQGHIDHALHFSTNDSCAGRYEYPATKTDGQSTQSSCIPEGARVQLDPSVDVDAIPGLTSGGKAVAKAMQTYGAYNQNNGGAPMAFGFENPAGGSNPYPGAGLTADYYNFPNIPWDKLRVLASWNGQ